MKTRTASNKTQGTSKCCLGAKIAQIIGGKQF
jgi:hypothetical protein